MDQKKICIWILFIHFNQHVQQLYKLVLIKLMKCYLCSGFLIQVKSNWCFSHLMLPLEFLFKIIVINIPKECDTIIDLLIHQVVIIFCFFRGSTALWMMAIAYMILNSVFEGFPLSDAYGT